MSSPESARAAQRPRPRAVARWLQMVAALVFLMVVVGGITRLTESGLSMVRWEPISGIVPPLDEAAWETEFAAYKATPEYSLVNRGMSLAEFKQIFFWEYVHRVLGRLIGLAFALPLLWFWAKRAIPRGYGPRLVALLALGGLQGTIGWWMVASGLVDRPDVSHIRLAVHLLNALFILGGLVWTARDLMALQRDPAARPARLTALGIFAFAILFVQLMLGAFTAGLDAGYAYPTWPLMGEALFPAGGWNDAWGATANLIDNPIVVQFAHRWFAWIAAGVLILLGLRARQAGGTWAAHSLAVAVALQIGLGIATLVSGMNIVLAVAHQAVAAHIVISAVVAAHHLGRAAR